MSDDMLDRLEVKILEGRDLLGLTGGVSDPYCLLKVGNEQALSTVCNSTPAPLAMSAGLEYSCGE